jgi:hypothetical protein
MKYFASVVSVLLALTATSAIACPGDKAKDDGKQSTPQKPTTSLKS